MMSHEHQVGRRRSAGLMGSPVINMFWLLGLSSVMMVFFAAHERWGLFTLMLFVWFVGLGASLIDYRRGLNRKIFMRLADPRFRVTGGKADIFYLTCGACEHPWEAPGVLVREYRKTFGPEALRRGRGSALPRDQERALSGVRCPACGAVDPGVLIPG